MTSLFPTQSLHIRKTLNRWDSVYRYEAKLENQKLQLYSLFFTDTRNLNSLSRMAQNLMKFSGESYLQIKGIRAYQRNRVFDKNNLQILTEFAKISLADNIQKCSDRSMKLSKREIGLLLKAFIELLYDLLFQKDKREFSILQHIKTVWNNEIFNSIYLGDNFEVKFNFLPDMSKVHAINWQEDIEGPLQQADINVIFGEIILKFVQNLCLYLPVKKGQEEKVSQLPIFARDQKQIYWDEIFMLPESSVTLISELLTTTQSNYEVKIRQIHRIMSFDGYFEETQIEPCLKYDYGARYQKGNIRITDELEFFRFLHNIGLDETVVKYYSEKMVKQSREKLDIDKIEQFVVQMVDISLIIFYELSHLNFSSLKKLGLQACGITSESLDIIFNWGSISGLEALDFSGNELYNNLIGSKGCSVIANCAKLSNLKELNLACCKLDDQGVRYLCESPYLTQLQTLDISLNKMITIEGYKVINECENLNKLTNLSLLCNQIGDKAIRELLKDSPNPKKYISLNLCDCLVSVKGLDALCSSESTKTLESLYLDANNFSVLNSWTLMKSLSKVKRLSAQSCNLDDFTLQTLLSITNLENLVYLDVSFNELLMLNLSKCGHRMRNLKEILAENTLIDQRFFERLTQKGEPHQLERVSLRRGSYYSTIFEQLAKNRLFPNLNFINLSRTSSFQNNLFFLYYPFSETSESLQVLHLSSTEIDLLLWKSALLNNVYFNNLAELKLVNVIRNGNSTIDVINKSGKFKNLQVLEMTACGLGDLALHLLAADSKLYKLKRLVLSLNMFRYRGVKKFLRSKLCSQLEYLDLTRGVIRESKKVNALRIYQAKYHPNLVFDI